jgi:hypothetical protein
VYYTARKYFASARTCEPRLAPLISTAKVFVASSSETLQLWHERLCHQNKKHVVKFLKQKVIEIQRDEEFCEGCVYGKQHRASFKPRKIDPKKPENKFMQMCVDRCNKSHSLRGAKYFVCFKDDFSKYRQVFFLKNKSEVAASLKTFVNQATTAGHRIEEFVSDGGKKFDDAEIRDILQLKGITFRKTMPYSPEQNGGAERKNRTIVETGKCANDHSREKLAD